MILVFKKGYKHTEETRKKMSLSKMRDKNPFYGKKHSKNSIIKMSEVKKGNKNSFYGKHHTKESRRKMSVANIGSRDSEETRTKKSKSHKGILRPDHSLRMTGCNNPLWKGGVSRDKYCPKFNLYFKKRVRARYDYKCVECGITKEENDRELDVHHVDFDKQTCCKNGEKISDQKFVVLCSKHHNYASRNMEWAIDHYTNMINEKYDGKSYLTDEEMRLYIKKLNKQTKLIKLSE